MKIMQMLAAGLVVAACNKGGPAQDTFPERQLGESTASPGANPSKPEPLTPDDPRVMNVSASISPQQQAGAVQTGQVPARTDATSSTPVQQPADIAPPSTTTETNRPGVFSPPPVSPATQPTSSSPPPPSNAPTPAPPPPPPPPQ